MNPAVPRRHPDSPQPVPLALRPLVLLPGLDRPTPRQWRELGESLLVGDEPMDRLVEWMSGAGAQQARPLFERALREGIDTLVDAPKPLREFFVRYEAVPDWVDWNQIRRAERVFRIGGTDGLYFARDVSLLGGYLASGFNKTLIRTGALEKGPAKRFAETLQWALDVTSDGGMRPLGRGYQATVRVRLIHAFVRKHVAALPDWDTDEWGVPINQTDMAATLIGALVAPLVGAMAMGVVVAPADCAAVAHLTRYVGWLIGVQERWLPNDFPDALRLLYQCMTAITSPDETSPQLAMPMADEPLGWHFRRLAGVRGRLARAQHLSIAATFLGPTAMARLGLSSSVPPGYPLLRVPINLVRTGSARLLPDGFGRLSARGRREQEAFLRTLIGEQQAVIGDSARHLSHAA